MKASTLRGLFAILWFAGLPAFVALADPAFLNPGFEDNGLNYNTSANSFKAPVASWTVSGSAGVMYNGNDAFTTGTGYGSQILGMRQLGGATQAVSGFSIGSNYVIVWQGNSREGISLLEIIANGHYVWSDATKRNAGAFLSYTSRPFAATSASLVISLRAPNSADMTTLLDNLQIILTTNAISPCVDLWPMTGTAVLGYTADPYGIAPYDGGAYIRCQAAVNATLTIRDVQAGNSYRASFYAKNRASGSPNDFRVSVDGNVLLGGTGYTVAGTAWTNLVFDFTATGATAALKFESLLTLGGDRTVCFDGFSVRANPSSPLAVRALTATAIGATNATLRGMLDGTGGENPQVVFCWGLTNQGTTRTGDWSFAQAMGANWGAGETFATNVGALIIGTTYWYQCFASNSTATDWSDSAQSFTTLSPAVISNADSVVDSVWAILKGVVTTTGGEAPSVWLHYWPSAGAPTSTVALGTQTNAFWAEIAGLTPGTTYAFAFSASNTAGWTGSSTNAFTTWATPWFQNARFEDNGPNYNPISGSFKAPVTNWTVLGSGGGVGIASTNAGDVYTLGTGFRSQFLGINTESASAPLGISQIVSGFNIGQNYTIAWDANCRPAAANGLFLKVVANNHIVWSDAISKNAGAFLSYTSRPFKATSTNIEISFINPSTNTVYSATYLDNPRILPTTNAPVAPFVDLFITTSGNGTYVQYPDGYGVAPYEGNHELRIQMAGSGTLTLRELRAGARYLVSYAVANRWIPANDFQVSVDGLVMTGGPNFTISGSGVWTNHSFTIRATADTASLKFEALNTGGGDKTVFFDAFGVEALSSPYGTVFVLN